MWYCCAFREFMHNAVYSKFQQPASRLNYECYCMFLVCKSFYSNIWISRETVNSQNLWTQSIRILIVFFYFNDISTELHMAFSYIGVIMKNNTSLFPQVYYERVNTHSASTSFAHACCGQRDASRNLVLDSKTPITKVRFSKGFAFANIEAASGE